MNRLTTDHPQNNFETVMNLVYGKDGWQYIRHGETEMRTTDFCLMLCKERGCVALENPMSDEEKDEYIKQNPAYGRIICRCETVSEGEIIDALRRNPKATDIDGVKRRTRAGMGRCQGGFCMPYVMRLIEKEMGKPMTEITKKGGKSNTVTGRL